MQSWPDVLVGRKLRLEALSEAHVEGLWKHASPEILAMNNSWRTAGGFEGFSSGIRALIESPLYVPFAMVVAETAEPVGSSSFMDLRLEHRSLEIGATWIAPRFQKTFVNPEAKLLMLTYAFETLDCVRVQLKTDDRNTQSQRAMEKLGCVKEGTLRNHLIYSDGYVRNTVMYSITSDEWPAVKASIVERLG